MTYTKLYPKLIQCSSLVPMDIPPLQPPYLRWYNENARYDYHSGNRGHSTKDCTSLKRKIHNLIKEGSLTFEDKDIHNVNGNPLPDHARPKINVMDNGLEMQIEKDVRAICMPMGIMHEALLKAGMLNGEREKKEEIEN